jgi:hypothetical protein
MEEPRLQFPFPNSYKFSEMLAVGPHQDRPDAVCADSLPGGYWLSRTYSLFRDVFKRCPLSTLRVEAIHIRTSVNVASPAFFTRD